MPEPTDTALILGRIEASESGIKQAFAMHEERDQERFKAVERALDTQTRNLTQTINGLGSEVKANAKGVSDVKTAVGLVQDREVEREKRKIGNAALWQLLIVAGFSGVLTLIVYVMLGVSKL